LILRAVHGRLALGGASGETDRIDNGGPRGLLGTEVSLQHITRTLAAAVVLGGVFFSVASVASADVVNVVADSVGSDRLVQATISVDKSVSFWVEQAGQGGLPGCDATPSSPAVLSYPSGSLPAGVTVTPASLSVTGCGVGNSKSFTFTSTSVGAKNIPAITVTDSLGVYNATPSAFKLVVAAPADSTPPGVSYTLNPAAADGTNGWYTSNVSLTWSVTEPESPESLVLTGCVDQSVTEDQDEQSYGCSATSSGGSVAQLSVSVKRDATAPIVSLVGGPTDGALYYENYNVPAAPGCTADDSGSGVNGSCSISGYSDSVGTHTTFATATDLAGNQGTSASVSYTVTADPTPPDVVGTLSPPTADGMNGWYTSDISLTWTVTEPETAVTNTTGCVDQSITADQTDQSYDCTATSHGGTTGPITKSIKRDGTPPTVTLVGGPASGGEYYANYNVPAAPTCISTDATSGVNGVCAVNGYGTLPGTYTVIATATDNAGNQGTASSISYTVLEDTTPPVITKTVTPTDPDGDEGWYTSNVTLTWTVTDPETPGSVAETGCEDQSITSDQAATTYSCSASSVGGSATQVDATIKRDATKPMNHVTGVANGATYTLGSVPAAGCHTTDNVSGVAQLATPSISGGPVGSVTATCSGGEDNAGNEADNVTVTFNVVYNWSGFLRPVDNAPTVNTVKAGSAIPVKFGLAGDHGLSILASGYPISRKIDCSSQAAEDAIELTVTAGASSLSYDANVDQYNYVWKTDKTWAGTCRQLVVRLVDGTDHYANFKLTK